MGGSFCRLLAAVLYHLEHLTLVVLNRILGVLRVDTHASHHVTSQSSSLVGQ